MIFTKARQHQLEGIIYHQCKFPELMQLYAYTSYWYANRKKAFEQIKSALNANKIPFLTFKGISIAKLMPVESLRTMGDVDLLVHEENKARTAAAISEAGGTQVSGEEHTWVFRLNDIVFELHHALLYEEEGNTADHITFANRVWEHAKAVNESEYEMEMEFHFVFLLLHLKKHFLGKGIGFRQFMDIAAVAMQPLDWVKVKGYLEEINLLPFARVCFALCSRWFDVSIPLSCAISDDFYLRATGHIFDNGVFGFDNAENNRYIKIANQLKNGVTKESYLRKKIFPSYDYMLRQEPYSFVKGGKYLLPIAWVYRWLQNLFNGHAKTGMGDALQPYTKRNEITEREEFIKQWQL